MRITTRDAFLALCASAFTLSCLSSPADASSPGASATKPASQSARPVAVAKPGAAHKMVGRAAPVRHGGPFLQCVTFARDVSGVHLSGNAHTWWHGAEGRFARGQRPEPGAVLNFRSSGGMRMGHVSVVSRVVSAREILIDDANWGGPGLRKGMVRRGASVIDVSPANDWTEVRVANGIGSWGRVYATYGFIYPRADRNAGSERIELAAERDQPAVPTRGDMRSRTAPATMAGGWSWQGPYAVHANDAPAPRQISHQSTQQAFRLPSAAMARAATPAPTRWNWVNGQAVALD